MLLQKEIIFMGYCPKCDMEFVDGITICTDCGGPLVESEEVAIAMKRKEQEERLLKQQEYLEKLNKILICICQKILLPRCLNLYKSMKVKPKNTKI